MDTRTHSRQSPGIPLPPRKNETESLRDVIERIVPECATAEEAEDRALAQIAGDDDLAEQAMRLGMRGMIGEMRTRLRAAMIRERRAEWKAPASAGRSFAGASIVRSSFFDWPLPNSAVMLGDATVADLEAAAAFHDVHRDAHAGRGAAYRQIAAILSASRGAGIVRAVIAEEQLSRILAGEPK